MLTHGNVGANVLQAEAWIGTRSEWSTTAC